MLIFISELIITSGGENVPPVPIEDRIKKEVPFLSNVMVVGDHRNYLTCLVSLKVCLHLSTSTITLIFSYFSVCNRCPG